MNALFITIKSRKSAAAVCFTAGMIVARPYTDGERRVIVDHVSGVEPKSPSCLDVKRALYPVNDIKVFYEYIRNNVTNFWCCPQLHVAVSLPSVRRILIEIVSIQK